MLVGKDWKIESDSLNVMLRRRVIREAKDDKPRHEYWAIMGYYSTVANALKALVELEVKGTGLKDLQTVVNKIDELSQQIEQATKSKLRKEVIAYEKEALHK